MNTADGISTSIKKTGYLVTACYVCIAILLMLASDAGFLSPRGVWVSLTILTITTAVTCWVIARRMGKKFRESPPTRVDERLNGVAMQENTACAVCYAFGLIGPVIFLLSKRYRHNRTIRFHAIQSAIYWITYLVVSRLLSPLAPTWPGKIWDAVLLLWPLLVYSAYRKKKVVLPIIGQIAERLA